MAVIKIDKFTGLAPKFAPSALPDSAAVESQNCNYNSGSLHGIQSHEQWRGDTAPVVAAGNQILGGFVWRGTNAPDNDIEATVVYTFYSEASFAQSPAHNDTHRRLYWTKEGDTHEFRFAKVPALATNQTATNKIEPARKESKFPDGPDVLEVDVDASEVSFKVGCINTSAWPDRKLESIYGALSVEPIGIEADIGVQDSIGVAMYAESGAAEVNISSDMNYEGLGTQVRGWWPTYRLTLSKNRNSYPIGNVFITTTATGAKYTPKAIKVSIGGSNAQYDATGWYSESDVLTYLVVAANGYDGDSTKGSAVTVYQITKTSSTDGGGDSGYGWVEVDVVGPPISLKYDSERDYRYMVISGTVPNEIATSTSGVTTVTTAPVAPTLRLNVDLMVDKVSYSTIVYEDTSKNTPVVINGKQVHIAITRCTAANLDELKSIYNVPDNKPLTVNSDFFVNFSAGSDQPIEIRSYVMTFVNQLGEESFPSEPVEIAVNPGKDCVAISVDYLKWLGLYGALYGDRHGGHGMRVYRTATSSTGDTEYLYAFTVRQYGITEGVEDTRALAGDTYPPHSIYTVGFAPNAVTYLKVRDTVDSAALGSACPTQKMIVDSDDLQSLQGLITIHNGMLAAFTGNSIYVSEPYLPWCWNADGVHTLPHKIIKLVAVEQGFVALTDTAPFYISGNLPEQLMSARIPGEYPCIGRNAATSVGSGVLYLSPDGPVMLSGMNAQVDTSVWSRESWRMSFLPGAATDIAFSKRAGLISYGHRIVSYIPGVNTHTYVFDADDGNWTHMYGLRIDCAVRIPAGSLSLSDNLAFADGTVEQGDQHACWTLFATLPETTDFKHHTKTFQLPRPVSMAAVQVFGYTRGGSNNPRHGLVEMRVYADDAQIHQTIINLRATGFTSPAPDPVAYEANPYGMAIARLPAGRMAARWSVELFVRADTIITGLHMATSMQELQNA